MFTLKLRWENRARMHGPGPVEILDRADTFVACDTVTVARDVNEETWREISNLYYDTEGDVIDMKLSQVTDFDDNGKEVACSTLAGVLIKAETPNGPRRWFTSHAWLLGPDGQTIERLA